MLAASLCAKGRTDLLRRGHAPEGTKRLRRFASWEVTRCLPATAPTPPVLFAGWVVIGLGMGIGLDEAGLATLAGLHDKDARGPITGITLTAGFASTVRWPLSGLMLATWGWREGCLGWALNHLAVALPLNACLPTGRETATTAGAPGDDGPAPSRTALALLAFVLAATRFNATAMAAHLPGLLQASALRSSVARSRSGGCRRSG